MIHDDISVRPALVPPAPARTSHPEVDPAMTVNDALRRIPNAGLVFTAFGVDACCGGTNTLVAAAHYAGLEPEVLLDALASVLSPSPAPARRVAEDAR